MTATKVLVLDADSAAGLETVQSLGRYGCTVDTASLRPEYARRRSRFIRRQITLTASNDGSIHQLVELFLAEKYDLIVPTTEVSLRGMLSPQIPDAMYERAVLAPRTSIETALDKEAVWNLAVRMGVRVPASQVVSAASLPPEAFPVVLKPTFSKRETAGGVKDLHVTIARDLTQWQTVLASEYLNIPVQQQQYIAGTGLGVELLYEHGKPRWAFLHQRIHELPLTGGGSSYRVSLGLRDDLVESATLLLAALEWHGVAMVEFKVSPSGEAYLMEINPRMWGSLALAIDCGVDFPVGLLCLSRGHPIPPQPKYRVGYYARNIYRDVEWFKINLKSDHADPLLLTQPVATSLFEWLRPLVGRESWDFFCWSDSGVILGEMRTLLREHWARVLLSARRHWQKLNLRYLQQPRMLRKLRARKIEKVLVLCHGNICRSPLAAALAARHFPEISFSSAGFYPEAGRPSPGFVLAAGEWLGIDLGSHRSKCVDSMSIEEAQLILIMDMRNYQSLRNASPNALDKTLFIGMLLPKPQLEIRDPYDNPKTMSAVSAQLGAAIERIGVALRMT